MKRERERERERERAHACSERDVIKRVEIGGQHEKAHSEKCIHYFFFLHLLSGNDNFIWLPKQNNGVNWRLEQGGLRAAGR